VCYSVRVPLYEYQCAKCGRFEVIRKFSDAPLAACPTCGGPVQKLLSAPAIQFKGTGWYVTDYARSGSSGEKKAGGKDGGDGGSKDSGSKDSGSKDSGSKDSGSKDSGKADAGGTSKSGGSKSDPA
jgi:putative FmdB family regulatory protein